jgi:hypothetical protein
MNGPNEFWLIYHRLLETYKAEGITPDDRTARIVEQFRRMPPSVKAHIVEDMDEFLGIMAELLVSVRSDANASDHRRELVR